MKEIPSDIFHRLRRRRPMIRPAGAPSSDLLFMIDFDETGAFVRRVDGKGTAADAGCDQFGGPVREVLKSLEFIDRRNRFRIDWDRTEDRTYLAENEFLIEQLARCGNVVDARLKPVGFSGKPARITCSIEPKGALLKAEILLAEDGNLRKEFRIISEGYVLTGDTVHRIRPLGKHFSELRWFASNILAGDLEKYLSLMVSSFEGIEIRYRDYTVAREAVKQTRPTLVFERVDPDNALFLKISPTLPGLDADFFDSYDVSRIAFVNDLERRITVRDVVHDDIYAAYDDMLKQLRKLKRKTDGPSEFFQEGNLFIVQEALARAFIRTELPHLLTRFDLIGAERLASYNIRAATPRLNLSLAHGIDFLDGDASLTIDGETLPLFPALAEYRKKAYISLTDGTQAIVSRAYMDKLERLFEKNRGKVRLSFFDLPIVEEMIDEKISEESFGKSRAIFAGFNDIHRTQPPMPRLNAVLRGYQRQGYQWLAYLHRHGLGGCLADDMGLGKTLQAITMLSAVYPDQALPSLVVMPKSLLFNWENELAKFNPELKYYTYHGLNRDIAALDAHQLILTTYAMVRNDIEQFRKRSFYYVVLDESQAVKNPNTQVSKAVILLNARHRLALSGTPIENNLGELYALFRFLNPAMFGSPKRFNKNYALPIQKDDDKEVLRELKKKVYPFILRRLKKDVLKDLPDKIEQILYVDMGEEQRLIYEERRRFFHESVRSKIAADGIKKSQFFIFQALMELRQIAAIPESRTEGQVVSPKRELMLGQIEEAVANHHKVLVFANFIHALECMAEDLNGAGIDYLMMTGATRDRKALVDRFQNDGACKVFLMTLKTGGLGLNLTAADYIFIFDPWWNRAAENQAVDRTHRIGQDKTVFSYKLITRGTIEEKILALQQLKSELFDNIISSDGASIKSMSESDVAFMLGDATAL